MFDDEGEDFIYELLLDVAQPLQFGSFLRFERRWIAHQLAVANLFAPLGEHERMDAQRLCDILDQHTRLGTQLEALSLNSRPGPILLAIDDSALSESAAKPGQAPGPCRRTS
jgi:hypothetical protein